MGPGSATMASPTTGWPDQRAALRVAPLRAQEILALDDKAVATASNNLTTVLEKSRKL